MISDYNSRKIRILNFVAILLVLYIHAVYTEASGYPIANYIQEVLAFGGLGLLANPLFYSISGFLFFSGISSIKELYPKVMKRGRTLLLPYFLWNVIFVLWFVVLQNLPGVSFMVNSDVIGSIANNGFLNGLYVMFIKPIAFQLWFLRDLILYVILSPLICFLLRRFRWFLPLLLFVAAWVGLIVLSSEIKVWGAFFYALGGYVGMFHSLEYLSQLVKRPIILTASILYLGNALIAPLVGAILPGSAVFFMLCGVTAVWGGYDLLVKTETSRIVTVLTRLGVYSFFIYCFHEPVFNIM